jgi:hypothetical protein
VVACVVGRTVLRRRRKAGSDPSARILGAWKESADWIAGCGLTVRRASLTPADVSAALAATSPDVAAHVERLAPLVDVALYSPDRPTPAQADESWIVEAALRREVNKLVTVSSRLRAAVDPRPLLRQRPEAVELHREPELV